MYKLIRTLAVGLVVGPVLLPAADKSVYSLLRPTPDELLRDMSTDRPDQTESPYTVDAGRVQLELDVVRHSRDRDRSGAGDVRVTEWGVAPVNLKLGLTHRLDLQLMVDPFVESLVQDRVSGVRERVSGFGDVSTRLKFNLWGNDGGTTAFAVMPFVKWPLGASPVRNGETEGGIIFVLSYALPAEWTSAVMTKVDFVNDGTSRSTEWLNSVTFSRKITGRLGCYFELVAVTSDAPGYAWQGQFDLGLTYGLTDNIQFDAGCNFGVTSSAPDLQPFVGFSRRF